jgi:hypothetical protein
MCVQGLASADFFDADRFPIMSVRSANVEARVEADVTEETPAADRSGHDSSRVGQMVTK